VRPRLPVDFAVLGAVAACFAVAMAVAVCMLDPALGMAEWIMVLRGAAAGLAVVSAVTAEALWRMRPWVWRASLALALACALAVIVVFATSPAGPLWSMLYFLAAGVVVGGPFLHHVRQRSRALWPHRHPPRRAAAIRAPGAGLSAAGGAAVNAPRP
jgi:hypothetical protein